MNMNININITDNLIMEIIISLTKKAGKHTATAKVIIPIQKVK